MATAQLIREARRGSGLTQRALAKRLKLGQSALADIERGAHDTRGDQLDRIVNAAGYRLAVLPTHAHSAADWADLIYKSSGDRAVSESVSFRALIGLNDDLAGVSSRFESPCVSRRPAPCGDPRFDAAVAALVEHHLTISRLPVPDWVGQPSRFLASPGRCRPTPIPGRSQGLPGPWSPASGPMSSEASDMLLFHKDDVEEALRALVEELVNAGAEAQIKVVGAAAIALQVGREAATSDIDALYGSSPEVKAAIERMAVARNWSPTWLNDAVKMYISHRLTDADWELGIDGNGVTIFYARPQLLLAMKLGRGAWDP